MPAYQPLPAALTRPLPLPPPPATRCHDAAGAPAVCVIDALLQIPVLEALLHTANADRARAAALGADEDMP